MLEMEKILQWISTLQTEGSLQPPDLLLAFLVARVSPLQHPPSPLAQDVLPGISQGSYLSLLQDIVSIGGGTKGEPHC
jgi:hypothetical protein